MWQSCRRTDANRAAFAHAQPDRAPNIHAAAQSNADAFAHAQPNPAASHLDPNADRDPDADCLWRNSLAAARQRPQRARRRFFDL